MIDVLLAVSYQIALQDNFQQGNTVIDMSDDDFENWRFLLHRRSCAGIPLPHIKFTGLSWLLASTGAHHNEDEAMR